MKQEFALVVVEMLGNGRPSLRRDSKEPRHEGIAIEHAASQTTVGEPTSATTLRTVRRRAFCGPIRAVAVPPGQTG